MPSEREAYPVTEFFFRSPKGAGKRRGRRWWGEEPLRRGMSTVQTENDQDRCRRSQAPRIFFTVVDVFFGSFVRDPDDFRVQDQLHPFRHEGILDDPGGVRVHPSPRAGRALHAQGVAVKTGIPGEGLDQQVVHRKPDRPAPFRVPAEQPRLRLPGLVFHPVLQTVQTENVRMVPVDPGQRPDPVRGEIFVLVQHVPEDPSKPLPRGGGEKPPGTARWGACTIHAGRGSAAPWRNAGRFSRTGPCGTPGPRRRTRGIPTCRAPRSRRGCRGVASPGSSPASAGRRASAGTGPLRARAGRCNGRTGLSRAGRRMPGARPGAPPPADPPGSRLRKIPPIPGCAPERSVRTPGRRGGWEILLPPTGAVVRSVRRPRAPRKSIAPPPSSLSLPGSPPRSSRGSRIRGRRSWRTGRGWVGRTRCRKPIHSP